MKSIRAPNGDIVQFPDNMSDAQITSVMQREYGSDHSFQGGVGVGGRVHPFSFADRMADVVGIAPQDTSRPIAPNPANRRPGMSTGEDAARGSVTGLQQGLTGMMGQGGNTLDLVGSAMGWAQNRMAGGAPAGDAPAQQWFRDTIHGNMPLVGDLPGSAPFDAKLQQTFGEYHQPQTGPGRLANRVAGMWPAAAGGTGGVVPRLASMAIPGATSFAASELAPEGYKDAAGLAGALMGGVATGAAFGRSAPEARMLAEQTPRMSMAQRAGIADALRRGRGVGLQPTLTEAIDATVPGARTTALQQYAEGTPAGVQTLGPRMAARPGQMQAAVGNVADLLAPETSPVQLETSARNAAGGAINLTRGQVNAPATPFYDALRGETVPPAEWAQLQQNPAFVQGLADLRNNPVLNRQYASLPDNSLAVVNEATKRIGARTTQATPMPGNPQSDSTLAGAYEHQGGEVNAQMRGLSPNWATARDTVAQGRQALLTPMQEGPLGQIAGKPGAPSPDLSAMADALWPSKPFEGQPQVTADALSAMDYQDPGIAGRMLRSFLQSNAAESGQLVAGKPNQFAPSNFSTRVGGNPIQREALLQGTRDASPTAGELLADALRTFDVTGRRLATGSNTVDKAALAGAVEGGGVEQGLRVAKSGGVVAAVTKPLLGWMTRLGIERHQTALVRAIHASPEEAARVLGQIEAARGNSALQRSLFTGFLAGSAVGGGGFSQ